MAPVLQAMGEINMKKHYSIGQQLRTVMIFLVVIFKAHSQSKTPYKINSVQFSTDSGITTLYNVGDLLTGGPSAMLPVNSVISAYNDYMAALKTNNSAACVSLGQTLRNVCTRYATNFTVSKYYYDSNNKIIAADLQDAGLQNAGSFGYAATLGKNWVEQRALDSVKAKARADVAAIIADALKKNAEWWVPCQQMLGNLPK